MVNIRRILCIWLEFTSQFRGWCPSRRLVKVVSGHASLVQCAYHGIVNSQFNRYSKSGPTMKSHIEKSYSVEYCVWDETNASFWCLEWSTSVRSSYHGFKKTDPCINQLMKESFEMKLSFFDGSLVMLIERNQSLILHHGLACLAQLTPVYAQMSSNSTLSVSTLTSWLKMEAIYRASILGYQSCIPNLFKNYWYLVHPSQKGQTWLQMPYKPIIGLSKTLDSLTRTITYFGSGEKSTLLSFSHLETRLKEILDELTTILIFYSGSQELSVFHRLSIELNPLHIIDAVEAVQYPLQLSYRMGLKLLLRRYETPYGQLHTAGNDAHYKLRELLMIVVEDIQRESQGELSAEWTSMFRAIARSRLPPLPPPRSQIAAAARRRLRERNVRKRRGSWRRRESESRPMIYRLVWISSGAPQKMRPISHWSSKPSLFIGGNSSSS